MSKYRIADEAKSDLRGIRTDISQYSKTAAVRFLERLKRHFRSIAGQPGMGRACEELPPGLRRFPVKEYIIFYRIKKTVVEITRVIHGAMDIEAIFHPEKNQEE